MAHITVKERDWDTQSVRSSRSQPRTFTTVRRYKIPDHLDETENETTRIVVRERDDHHSHHDAHSHRPSHYDYDYDEPEPRIQYRVVERGGRERDWAREARSDVREEEDIHITATHRHDRSPSPEVLDVRISRDVDRERDLRPPQSPYSLEKYSKSTEYFSRPEPQPIIIRQERAPQPIIIHETIEREPQKIVIRKEREPSYDIIEHDEIEVEVEEEEEEEKSVVKVEPGPEPEPPREDDEQYYYERKVIRRQPMRRDWEDEDRYDRRHEDQNYYSDDDAVYIRREYEEDVTDKPRHRRRVAEGVIGGIAAAELVRHHRKRQGENPGSRVGQVVSYGALGGIGAEALSRLNKNRDRSSSGERGGRRRHRHKSRTNIRSLSRGKTLAGLAGLAALGAVAYAAGKKGGNKTTIVEDRRSRSRRRRRSTVRHYSSSRSPSRSRSRSRARSESRHMDPEHRNRKLAQAGLVGAAAAGLAEHVRNRSRGGRSKSRVREGAPIVGAGLASAAVAGLYERSKAKKEKKAIARSRSRSYSRSRSSDSNLVEYGGDPIQGTSADRRRSRSRGRSSSGSSPDQRRRGSRSRSRSRALAEGIATAGVVGVAANEINKRRQRKRDKKRDDSRRRHYHSDSDSVLSIRSDTSTQFYPASNQFAPPPPNFQQPYHSQNFINGGGYAEPVYASGANIPVYNPANFGPTNGPTLPPDDPYVHQYNLPHQDPYSYEQHGRHDEGYRSGPDNVSAPRNFEHSESDGVISPPRELSFSPRQRSVSPRHRLVSPRERSVSPRARSQSPCRGRSFSPRSGSLTPTSTSAATPKHQPRSRSKSVKFPVDPVQSELSAEEYSSPEDKRHSGHRRKRRRSNDDRRLRDDSSTGSDSGETVDLPPRFDSHGKRVPERGEDPIADTVQNIVSGLLGGSGSGASGSRGRR
ncbi:hypothetical protein BLS_006937 [Venturia inaequalis]|uniref:DUF3824 domain-containing protein n=1 Tax=Venturia inaequalis TaxID=5025 RepID=A0A8H3UBK9_VENIN|nr:hypothetical protein BLS_006937 [Venturia inaequalis]